MRLALTLLTAVLIPTCLQAQTPPTVSPETRAAVTKLVGDIMVNGQAYGYDRDLADGIGPRLTGSPNYALAVNCAQKQFGSMGLANVHTETFTMPALWEPDVPAAGQIIEPRVQALHIYSAGWSPSPPQDGVLGKVIYLSALLP